MCGVTVQTTNHLVTLAAVIWSAGGGIRPLSFIPIGEPATSPSTPADHELGPTGTLQTDPILEVLPRARSVSVLASCHAHVERNLCNAHDHTMYTPAPLTARRHGPRVRHIPPLGILHPYPSLSSTMLCVSKSSVCHDVNPPHVLRAWVGALVWTPRLVHRINRGFPQTTTTTTAASLEPCCP